MNLPVPVPAESKPTASVKPKGKEQGVGEAPESINHRACESKVQKNKIPDRKAGENLRDTDSGGGQNPQQKWREKNKVKLAKYMRDWRAQQKAKK